MKKSPQMSIQYLKGVGPKRAKLLERLGIRSCEDLLYYFPKRYEDRSEFAAISQLKAGEPQTILVTILAVGIRRSFKRKLFILEAVVQDKTGRLRCLWFNQPYLKKYFEVGRQVVLYGKPEIYQGRLQMNSPEYEILDKGEELNSAQESLNIGRIVPIYPLTEGLTQRYFRKITKLCLNEFISGLADILPYDIRKRLSLLNLAQSLNYLHFPKDSLAEQEAFRRISFEEFFLYQVPVVLRKLTARQRKGIAHKIDALFLKEIRESLNFKLTDAQERVLNELIKDMASTYPMHRLLQGEVGSGKTIVAFLASLIALNSGYQVAFMVPTEILVGQHYQNFLNLIQKITKAKDFKIALLTSSLNKKSKDKIYQQIKSAKIKMIIGTHAILQEGLVFQNLGLVVIDEQHKFGVAQRALLPQKGNNPDVLIMTATPIPRTLSLTIYADLDISCIDELPSGRLMVKTLLYSEGKRQEVYKFIEEKVKEGRQVYIVYPIIEESLVLDLKAAKKMHEILKIFFKQFSVGLIHGKLNQSQQDKIMSEFKNGKIDILLATSVLEVGVDVANASVMVIEHAERFGLSQLHQLRGRIGRGIYQSYCILLAKPIHEEAKLRIEAITTLNDGFRIAEEDLRIRGPGEFFGERQSGLSELRIANPLTQVQLLKQARNEAIKLIREDPLLSLRANQPLKEFLKRRFPEYERLKDC